MSNVGYFYTALITLIVYHRVHDKIVKVLGDYFTKDRLSSFHSYKRLII